MNFSMPSRGNSEGGVLGNLKSKLGFGDGEETSRSARSRRRDDADDYEDDEYGYQDEFGYDDEYGTAYDEQEYADYGPDYDDQATGSFEPVNTASMRSSSRSNFPNLVTIDDVKARTAVPDSLNRDPLPQRRVTPSRSASASMGNDRIVVDDSMPASYDDAPHAYSSRSASVPQGVYDPYEAYSSSAPTTHTPTRSITVLRPQSYGDVAQVAKIVRAGDMVVLSLANTPDDLSKRVLDFSFGVASALDASVESPGDKVFAIAKGSALSAPETQALRNQGVL